MTLSPFFSNRRVTKIQNNNFKSLSKKNRSGISPVISTTIILAITITLGLGLWSFANSGVGSATQSYAQVVTDIGRYTSDRFVIANLAFDYPAANNLSVWIYNSGTSQTQINNIVLTCKDCSNFTPVTVDKTQLTGTNPIPGKAFQQLSFNSGTTLITGKTYQVQVVSSSGAYQTYFQQK